MICAIVLAAGRSRRMGRQKLLLPFAGSTVIAHIVDQVLASAVDETYVVVGADADEVASALAGRRVSIVTNPMSEAEMLGSVRRGLEALPEDCRGALVVLGDQLGITPALIDALIAAFRDGPKGIVAPSHRGARGHPILFAARYRERIMGAYDGVGLRGLVLEHAADVLEVNVPDAVGLADMDTPDDYRRELSRRPGTGADP